MLVEIDSDWLSGLFKDDPVRPHIAPSKRITGNKKAFVLFHEDGVDALAVICTAYCDSIPTNEQELDNEGDSVAVFYTVWSYQRGSGREIIDAAISWVKQNKPAVKRFVTLSPKTRTAERFHTRNGAVKLQENEDTINFEYEV